MTGVPTTAAVGAVSNTPPRQRNAFPIFYTPLRSSTQKGCLDRCSNLSSGSGRTTPRIPGASQSPLLDTAAHRVPLDTLSSSDAMDWYRDVPSTHQHKPEQVIPNHFDIFARPPHSNSLSPLSIPHASSAVAQTSPSLASLTDSVPSALSNIHGTKTQPFIFKKPQPFSQPNSHGARDRDMSQRPPIFYSDVEIPKASDFRGFVRSCRAPG